MRSLAEAAGRIGRRSHANVSPSLHDRLRPAAPRRDRDRRHRRRRACAPTSASSATGSSPSATCRRSTRASVATVLDVDRAGRRARASSIRTATRTGRSSSTARWPATSTRATRPSCRATAATPSRRSPTPAASSSSCRSGRTSSSPRWATFGEYLDRGRRAAARAERRVPRRPRHGPRVRPRAPTPRAPTADELAAMVGAVEAAMDAGAIGLSTGLIYAPGMHAPADEVEALVAAATRRGGLYATHMRNECDGLFDVARRVDRGRSGRRARAPGSRSRTSSAARASVWGRAGEAVARLEARPRGGPRRRRRPVPVHRRGDDPRHDPAAGAPGPRRRRVRVRARPIRTSAISSGPRSSAGSRAGRTSPSDPGWDGLRISFAASHPDWSGRSLAELADELHARPARPRLRRPRRRPARRLGRHRVHARAGRRDDHGRARGSRSAPTPRAVGPGHPILDAGRPHPRTYGSTARVLGHVRPRARDRCRSRPRSRS